jgi:hypothetical protein
MSANSQFDEVLDAVEKLLPDEQGALIAIVQRRLAEEARRRVVADVQQGRVDFQQGQVSESSIEDLLREIDS